MGKKGHNWKARQVVKTITDNSAAKDIKLDLDVKGHYDESNPLILPAIKGKTKIIRDKVKITRILSKKNRKKLEKVVNKKEKKAKRADLLESLQKVQATPEELSQLTSIASVQTKGLKRHFFEEQHPELIKFKGEHLVRISESSPGKLNTIKGAAKKRKQLLQTNDERKDRKKFKNNDPNIVGFSDIDDDDEDDEEESNIQEVEAAVNNEIQRLDNKAINSREEEVILNEPKVEIIEIKDSSPKKLKTVEAPAIARKPAVYVDVLRNEEIQAARLKLPILAEEQQIMEVINENSIIIIAGETGSGKTTQVPQFLYEAGYALNRQIAVTEPRRVAAISMSQRVATEMNLTNREISYLIRFEGNVTQDTKIKFMTDGVLFKEIQEDFLLKKYSVIIIDEAHERSVNTDILLGFLAKMVPLRAKKGDPLKLIIMSATLRLNDFLDNKKLFRIPPPVINVEARQYSVTIHFNKRTESDYLKSAYKKIVKIHTSLPEGGILVFVTGQREVNYLVKKLRRTFPLKQENKMFEREEKLIENEDEETVRSEDDDFGKKKFKGKRKKLKTMPKINLDDYLLEETDNNNLLSDDEYNGLSSADEEDLMDDITVYRNLQPLWTLPLFSMLPTHKQQKVFDSAPKGCRLCIISTNVAETSLTIPNIKYVVDTGKTKLKLYDKTTGLTRYLVQWTSKASANQRTGRAGRTGPGHCYRLYSSAVFNDEFPEFDVPEIQSKPIDDLYLQMKRMKVPNIQNFPFPSPPDLIQFKTAEQRLEILGALKNGEITPVGRSIAKLPISPRFGIMLARSHQENLLPYTVCLVAALSVPEVLLETPLSTTQVENQKEIQQKWAALRQHWAGAGNSLLLGDNGVLLKAVGAAEYENSKGKLQKFCENSGLRHKAVVEIRKLRLQITSELQRKYEHLSNLSVDPQMIPPTDYQAKLLREILLCGMADKLAKKVALEEVKDRADKLKFKYAYWVNNMKDPVFLHSTSVLRRTLPEFVVFNEIYETNKIYMRGVTAIDPKWLPVHVPALCKLSDPLTEPEPYYNEKTGKVYCWVTGTIGSQAWELPQIEVPFPQGIDNIKWFARFLLEGKPFKKLEKFTKNLLSQPSVMIKKWANLQPRTQVMLKALLEKQISSKSDLENAWKENSNYLKAAFLQWVPESLHNNVVLIWPPLD